MKRLMIIFFYVCLVSMGSSWAMEKRVEPKRPIVKEIPVSLKTFLTRIERGSPFTSSSDQEDQGENNEMLEAVIPSVPRTESPLTPTSEKQLRVVEQERAKLRKEYLFFLYNGRGSGFRNALMQQYLNYNTNRANAILGNKGKQMHMKYGGLPFHPALAKKRASWS